MSAFRSDTFNINMLSNSIELQSSASIKIAQRYSKENQSVPQTNKELNR